MASFPDSDSQPPGPDELICPYTGLRTFTEDEAIYFRGREEHVANCLALLAQQHFVMVTGASGDGKSSLVFAGMLPEVRAGFVRARYGNWAVATCRPERSPLRNLADALADALRLPGHARTVETELQQGFSALVQLYEASALHPPAPDPTLPPAEQRRQLRQGANLLLVVDQFEEFFTNPENYDGPAPNVAAQTVVNLLLETARLARERELPIYIVCTMRSDFVGQCAEFRGLIEQVGASQYFVPRLLRHEFVQVIRDPAELSGNRISERLVQRLLFDTNQGQDQLPVLQHALRRIWLAADHGREQMDLLHYAMVGGLNGELPAADRARFAAWRATLPAGHDQFLLANASLRNVLDAHANQLYAEAGAGYNRDFAPPLPPGTAERVIELTFRVLTRTDGKRVVRNRLTGAEITAIIDDAALPWPVVCRLLRPFRQADATFLQPFIGEGDDPLAVPPPETVLDITHESLIRNWQLLSTWAAEEARDVRFATNLLQEAQRWQENGESKGFLLPIGLYSVFARWAKDKRGLTAWLAYYFDAGPDPAQRLHHAAQQHALLARYLAASRRRLRAQLVLARYGVWRLALAVLLPLLLGGLAWAGWQWRTRQDDYVAYAIVDERAPLLTSSFVPVQEKASFLLSADRLGDAAYQPWLGGRRPADYAFPRMLDALHNDTLALNIGLSMYSAIDVGGLSYDSLERENPMALRLVRDLAARLAGGGQRAGHAARPSPAERALAVPTARAIMVLTHYQLTSAQRRVSKPEPPARRQAQLDTVATLRQHLLGQLLGYVRREVATTTGPTPSPVALSFCLRVLLGQGSFAPGELAFLQGMNPFGTPAARGQFARLYPANRYLYDEHGGYTDHAGGYLTAAMVLAALRQPAPVLEQCLRQLDRDAVGIRETDGAFVLLPYLVKYELLTKDNLCPLLRACSRVGDFSLNEMYAALVYSLLSERPGNLTHDVGQLPSPIVLNQADDARLGGVNPALLNIDRASYSVPVASRDLAWRAVLAAMPVVATYATVFSSQDLGNLMLSSGGLLLGRQIREAAVDTTLKSSQHLFIEAFTCNRYGIYLHELKHRRAAATRLFDRATVATTELSGRLRAGEGAMTSGDYGTDVQKKNSNRINPAHWTLGFSKEAPGYDSQDPISFLYQPTRPKTRDFGGYYTCPFDALFSYQLRGAVNGFLPDPTTRGETDSAYRAARALAVRQRHQGRVHKLDSLYAPYAGTYRPNPAAVRQLDSLAFVEAVFPDRFSRTRTRSLWAEALSRPPQFQPNLRWLQAINRYQLPGDSLRRRRNAVLLAVATALQDSAGLTRLRVGPGLHAFIGQLPQHPEFAGDQFQILFSDLASALAHAGRTPEAFRLASWLDHWNANPARLRAAEQVLLAGRTLRSGLADSFLLAYARQLQARPKTTPLNAFGLFYGRSYLSATAPAQELRTRVNRLAEEADVPNLFCERAIGYSLSGHSYRAVREAPTYLPEHQRQLYFNSILLSLAHLHAQTHLNGWHEYDHTMLSAPIPGTPDYVGPSY
jgi:hypothetical protein